MIPSFHNPKFMSHRLYVIDGATCDLQHSFSSYSFYNLFQTYVFLPEDEEECKFECLGQWDGYTIAAMIEDFHIMKFLRNSSL